jgi:hypothetical protein
MDFKIKLDKNTYNAAETAKGALLTKSNKSLKARKLKFSVCGKERYEKSMVGQWGDSSEKYDIFFFEDLTPQLKPTFDFSQDNDNNKIEIPPGSYAIPFHFSIPRNALESYRGRHAQITMNWRLALTWAHGKRTIITHYHLRSQIQRWIIKLEIDITWTRSRIKKKVNLIWT